MFIELFGIEETFNKFESAEDKAITKFSLFALEEFLSANVSARSDKTAQDNHFYKN